MSMKEIVLFTNKVVTASGLIEPDNIIPQGYESGQLYMRVMASSGTTPTLGLTAKLQSPSGQYGTMTNPDGSAVSFAFDGTTAGLHTLFGGDGFTLPVIAGERLCFVALIGGTTPSFTLTARLCLLS